MLGVLQVSEQGHLGHLGTQGGIIAELTLALGEPWSVVLLPSLMLSF